MRPPRLRQRGKKEKALDWLVSSLISPLEERCQLNKSDKRDLVMLEVAQNEHDGFENRDIPVHQAVQRPSDDERCERRAKTEQNTRDG